MLQAVSLQTYLPEDFLEQDARARMSLNILGGKQGGLFFEDALAVALPLLEDYDFPSNWTFNSLASSQVLREVVPTWRTMPFDLSPDEWVQRLSDGDPAAWDALFRELVRLARRWDLDEDAIQVAFVKLWISLREGKFHASAMKNNPKGWVVRVARNVFIDVLRKRRREVPVEFEEDFPAAISAAESELIHSQREKLLFEAISKLSEPQRKVIELTYFTGDHITGDRNAARVAKLLGCSVSAVENRKFSAMQSIRKFFSQHGEVIQPSGRGRPPEAGPDDSVEGAEREEL